MSKRARAGRLDRPGQTSDFPSYTRGAQPYGTTLAGTIVPSAPGAFGYRRLERQRGEQLLLRTDLGGAAPSSRLRSLVTFVHLSDLHVTDAQSPARAEYLDRYGDSDSPHAPEVGRVGTYRAQEALTHQVVEAMARRVRQLQGGPLTGAPIDFALSTGDATDNCQENELRSYIALLEGGREINPDSGDPHSYQGVGSWSAYDPRYWHPDGTPPGRGCDRPRSMFGFPEVPGLLDACRQPFLATGLGLPWYAVYGNHDGLLCGTVAPTARLAGVAVGGAKALGVGAGADITALITRSATDPSAEAWERLHGPTMEVASDPSRRLVTINGWLAAHRTPTARPAGHGFDLDAVAAGRAWYGFDVGVVRFLVLDTVNPAGGWQGCLSEEQFRWLERELEGGHGRYLGPHGEVRHSGAADRLFVLVSHHPLETLINGYAPDAPPRRLENDVSRLLARFPNVVCWVNGHTHTSAVRAVPTDMLPASRPDRIVAARPGGWWQITTPSHIDWPQQARVVELTLDEVTGDLLIGTAMVDHLGAVDPRLGELADSAVLAGWSRELAANAWQGRISRMEPVGRGSAADRNVLLVVPAPSWLR